MLRHPGTRVIYTLLRVATSYTPIIITISTPTSLPPFAFPQTKATYYTLPPPANILGMNDVFIQAAPGHSVRQTYDRNFLPCSPYN